MPLDQTGGARPPSRGLGRTFHPNPKRRGRFRRTLRRVLPEPAAETLLRAIFNGADFLMSTDTEVKDPAYRRWHLVEKHVHLLVSISPEDFEQLCSYGGRFEDDEETEDFEPDADAEASLVPAGDGHFRFEHLRTCVREDGERGDAPAEKVEAMRERYKRGHPLAEIRTGDGRLVGQEQPNGLISMRLGRAGR